MMRFSGDTTSIDALFKNQLSIWDLARENYAGLENILVKAVSFDGYEIKVQYNPKRIISSSAKVDIKSVSERPCFLCSQNRPVEQLGIQYEDDYVLLVNPYPVFRKHLTIPSIRHQPQRILERFGTMLKLAGDLPGFTLIYNGPACGASAPDHFHFQAIMQNRLPIERDVPPHKPWISHGAVDGVELFTRENYLNKAITFTGNQVDPMTNLFYRLYERLVKRLPEADEPMMNILARYAQGNWIVHLFPRRQHRPAQYFEPGEKQLLLSPASMDMGGVLIMPRENDYQRLTRTVIEDVFRQVCVDDHFIHELIQSLIHSR